MCHAGGDDKESWHILAHVVDVGLAVGWRSRSQVMKHHLGVSHWEEPEVILFLVLMKRLDDTGVCLGQADLTEAF